MVPLKGQYSKPGPPNQCRSTCKLVGWYLQLVWRPFRCWIGSPGLTLHKKRFNSCSQSKPKSSRDSRRLEGTHGACVQIPQGEPFGGRGPVHQLCTTWMKKQKPHVGCQDFPPKVPPLPPDPFEKGGLVSWTVQHTVERRLPSLLGPQDEFSFFISGLTGYEAES